MNRFLYKLFASFFLNTTLVIGQTIPTGTLTGRVVDKTGQPAGFATVRLQLPSDTIFLTGTVCDAAGLYTLERVPPGTYRLVASLVGHGPGRSDLVTFTGGPISLTVTPIYLSDQPNTLNEVSVRVAKPFVEQLSDRTVLNVERSPIAAGGTALEVLERAPGVVVDPQNDRIQLQGLTGVLILMDDKPTYLSMADVVNLLRNTPANTVEAIELITKPSARYDATGNAGIINIRLKRSKPPIARTTGGGSVSNGPIGTNGSLSVGGGYARFPKANVGLLVNHRTGGGWSLFGTYTYDYRRQWSDMNAWRTLQGDNLPYQVQNLGERLSQTAGHTYRIGADYALGSRSVAGLVVNGNLNEVQGNVANENLIYSPNGWQRGTIQFGNTFSKKVDRFVANASFRHRFDSTGRSLSVDIDYSRVNSAPRDSMVTRSTELISSSVSPIMLQRSLSPSQIIIRSVKADYVYPLAKGVGQLETGWKSSHVRTDNDMQFDNQVGSDWLPDPKRTNHFVYDETIHAAYISGNRNWTNWSLQAGLRAEFTQSTGNSVTLGTVVTRQYLDLFPSVSLTRRVGANHQFRSVFSRRIDRPNYQQMNPFVYVVDTYTYSEGDPYLRPQYTQAFELSYTYKNETNLSLSYNRIADVIAHINEQRGEQLRIGPANLTRLHTYNLTVGFPLKPTRWWSVRTTVNTFINLYEAVVQNQSVDNWGLATNINMSHSFVLPKGLTAEVAGYYNSPYVDGITRGYSDGQLSVGLQKPLWNKLATLRLNVSDVFFTSRFAGLIQHGQTDLYWVSRRESRVARLAFSYNFGNQKLKNLGQRRSGAEDEQRRSN